MAVMHAVEMVGLAEPFGGGDDDVLREVFAHVTPKICRWLAARYRRSRLDCHQIEEIVNFAVFRAWRARARFDPKTRHAGGVALRDRQPLLPRLFAIAAGPGLPARIRDGPG